MCKPIFLVWPKEIAEVWENSYSVTTEMMTTTTTDKPTAWPEN